jgi:SAM-dependent methyltransferase
MDFKFFWEGRHVNNDTFYLTGSNLDNINYYHNILGLDNLKEMSFLEIGVGHGNLSHELVNLVNKLICCDISSNALNKVSDKVYAKYLTNDIKTIEPVDFILCHLVLQHCNDEEVGRIINDVNLKKDGIMSIQIAFLVDETKSVNVDNNIHFFRNLPNIQNIISKTNKKIIEISKPFNFNNEFKNIGWYVIKLENK